MSSSCWENFLGKIFCDPYYPYLKNCSKNYGIVKELKNIASCPPDSESFNQKCYTLEIILPNGESKHFNTIFTLSHCQKLLKALDIDRNNYSSELLSWGARLAVELKVETIDNYIHCVDLINCRYRNWEIDGRNYEELFRDFILEIKAIKLEYENLCRDYYDNWRPDKTKPQFISSLKAIVEFIKNGKSLKCGNISEYVKLAQKEKSKSRWLKWRTREKDGEKRVSWNIEAVYRDNSDEYIDMEIETYRKRSSCVMSFVYLFTFLLSTIMIPYVSFLMWKMCILETFRIFQTIFSNNIGFFKLIRCCYQFLGIIIAMLLTTLGSQALLSFNYPEKVLSKETILFDYAYDRYGIKFSDMMNRLMIFARNQLTPGLNWMTGSFVTLILYILNDLDKFFVTCIISYLFDW